MLPLVSGAPGRCSNRLDAKPDGHVRLASAAAADSDHVGVVAQVIALREIEDRRQRDALRQNPPLFYSCALRAVDGLRRGQLPLPRGSSRVRPAPLPSVAAVLQRVPPVVAALIRVQWLTRARPGGQLFVKQASVRSVRTLVSASTSAGARQAGNHLEMMPLKVN